MKKRVLVSDLTDAEIPDGDGVVLRVVGYPKPDDETSLDVSRAEVETLLAGKGRVGRRRGRPRKQ